MKILSIVWQRLVNTEGVTCPRCGSTGREIEEAAALLTKELAAQGISVSVECKEISEAAFLEQPSESNRIWISGKPLEYWLQGSTGSSRCCAACGDAECRTVEIDDKTYETIPTALILRAARLAAATL